MSLADSVVMMDSWGQQVLCCVSGPLTAQAQCQGWLWLYFTESLTEHSTAPVLCNTNTQVHVHGLRRSHQPMKTTFTLHRGTLGGLTDSSSTGDIWSTSLHNFDQFPPTWYKLFSVQVCSCSYAWSSVIVRSETSFWNISVSYLTAVTFYLTIS